MWHVGVIPYYPAILENSNESQEKFDVSLAPIMNGPSTSSEIFDLEKSTITFIFHRFS